MITHSRGKYRVETPDGFLVGITSDRAEAERWEKLLAERISQLNVSLPGPLAEQFRAYSYRHGVRPSAMARALIQAATLGIPLKPEERATGWKARSEESRNA